jgi:hypothetical protein
MVISVALRQSARQGGEDIMGKRFVYAAAAVVMTAAFTGACTRPGSGNGQKTTTTVTPGTVPVSGYVITGVTQNQACGGLGSGNTCKPPQPASDKVTVRSNNKVIAAVTSAEDGRFVIVVDAGTYTVQASTSGAQCTLEKVVLNASQPTKELTLTCTT